MTQAALHTSERVKKLFDVFLLILNSNFTEVVAALDKLSQFFTEDSIKCLFPLLLETVRSKICNLIAVHYVNIPFKELSAALNLKYDSDHLLRADPY